MKGMNDRNDRRNGLETLEEERVAHSAIGIEANQQTELKPAEERVAHSALKSIKPLI